MSVKYTKTKTGGVNIDRLTKEIADNTTILVSLDYIQDDDVSDNSFDLYFNTSLPTNEETELDTIITNHVKALLPSINNVEKTSSPTANDDSNNTSGNGFFSVGSQWLNVTTGLSYRLIDSSVGNAVWLDVTSSITEVYGELYEANDAGSVITTTTAGIWYKWTTITIGEIAGGDLVTVENSGLKIGPNGSDKFDVDFDISFNGTNSTMFQFALFKNGVKVDKLAAEVKASNNKIHLSSSGILDLVTNDIIDLRVKSDSSAATATIYKVNLNISNFGGKRGSQGPQGNGDLIWKTGGWSDNTSYILNDTIQHNGSTYTCTLGHTSDYGTEPGVGGNWTNKWDLVAQKGDAGIQGPTMISLGFGSGTLSYWRCTTTNYAIASNFIFPGTSKWVPTTLKIIYSSETTDAIKYHQWRLYDKTNGLVIVESGQLSVDINTKILTLTGLTNLPSGEAIFEIQGKRINDKDGYIHYMELL